MTIKEADISEFCDQHGCIAAGYGNISFCNGCPVAALVKFVKIKLAIDAKGAE